jgi:CBS domain-containing protein
MRETPIGNLMRVVRTVAPEDPIGKAAELLRVSGLPGLPIVNSGRLVGMITEGSILNALNTDASEAVAEQPISDIVSRDIVCVNPYMTLGQVAGVMADHNLAVAPVVDTYGSYLGMAVRSDVTTALSMMIRPPTVGGMATPLGVYLTTGSLRAGAGDLGLFLAGATLALMMCLSVGAIYGLAALIDLTGVLKPWSLFSILMSGPMHLPNWLDIVRSVMLGLTIPIWILLMRILPVSGYHAAEHQVVHAMEQGEPLKPANVLAMPRVHPRCGTNIVAAVMLFMLLTQVISTDIAVLVFVFVLVLSWRVIGGYVQYYVTTKPPSQKQLASGIRAGESLIEQYRKNPGYTVFGWKRIWNTGMPQVMLGAAAVYSLISLLWPAAGRVL